jgi:hypothetical protein
MEETTQQRLRVAQRIHDLLLLELGEAVEVGLLLGPPEYARAVLSLCRSCGSTELVRLAEEFVRATDAVARLQRQARSDRSCSDWRVPSAGEWPGACPPPSPPAA